MRWLSALLLALLASTGVGAGFAALVRPSVRAPSERDVAAPFEAERAVATRAGLETIEEGSTADRSVRRELPLHARHCAALVATADGADTLASAVLFLSSGQRAGIDAVPWPARIVHVALCAQTDTTMTVELHQTTDHADWGAPSHLRFAILEGVVAAPRAYTRLTVDAAAQLVFDETAVRAREAALAVGGARIGDSRVAHRGAAVLLPASRSTHAAVHVALGAHTIPQVDAHDAESDPFRAPEDRAVPARVHTSSGLARLLAVIDAGGLGAPCLSLTFARLSESPDPVVVRRIAVPSLEEVALPLGAPGIAIDAICPASGLFFYTVDEDLGGDYLVSAYADAARSDVAAAVPSQFEPTPLRVAEVVAAQRGCEAGRARECLGLAALAAASVDGAGSPAVPLERACQLGDGEGCDRLATFVSSSTSTRDRARADELERNACAAGYAPACLRRAARFREGARDLPAAYSTYRFACGLGDASACTAVRTMEEWQLAISVGPNPTAGSLP